MRLLEAWVLPLTLLPAVQAFYLPGAAPHNYEKGERVPLLVNALTPRPVIAQDGSMSTERTGVMSFDYYLDEFGFCKPDHPPRQQAESLGSALFGDRLFDSPFEIRMLENVTCAHLCTTTMTPKSAKFLHARIAESMSQNWLVDSLPAAEMKQDEQTKELFYSAGFPLGRTLSKPDEPVRVAINNHFDIHLEYHSPDGGLHQRVVGAVVWPRSTNSLPANSNTPDCSRQPPYEISGGPFKNGSPDDDQEIAYTYSVYWRESSTTFATRWDHYLRVFDPRIHALSLVNSVVIALFLCIMVFMILLRTVHKDISRYNQVDLDDDIQEDFGWKLVHGEVFRPPRKRMLLSVAVGSGAQMLAMSAVTLFFALLGFLSPSNRGALSTLMLVTYTLFGFISGYVSSRLFATLRGEEWKKNILLTAVLFPGFLFGFLHLLNFFLIGSGSSGAVPFGTFLAILAMWFLVNIPLTIAGAWAGVRKGGISHPVRTNQIPRQIAKQDWWLKPWPAALLAGILPFGAGFIEVSYLMQSLFGPKLYIAFGYLFLTSIIVALTTATATILMCYFHLCAEDYRWHFRAFLAGGGSAFWLMAYGLLYWATKLQLPGLANKVLYLGYLLLLCLLDFFVTGTIGFVATYAFLRVIYSRIRVD